MDIEKILENIKNKIYHPVYFLSGEEPYFIDKISKTIEKTVLSDAEKEFNQAIVYGRDVDMIQITSLAREYPVLGNYRVVIVREAQGLKDIEKDERFKTYLKNPTIKIVAVSRSIAILRVFWRSFLNLSSCSQTRRFVVKTVPVQ
jgi:DNA polymerase-3 subunit delta